MSLPQLDVRFASLVGDLSRVVRGEVRATTLDRGLFAADASPYEVAPLAVASPRDAEDLQGLVAWCRDHDVPVLPRGAGTSLAGQSVGEAVVVDCSTHLNRILHLDPEARTARVEPGVVLDDLRRAAGRHGLTFGPDVSTATHATLGGMMGNASAGASSIIHGMTDEHVRSIDAVLADGRRLELGAVDPSNRGPDGELARGLESIVRPLADEIRARFPRVARNVGGYRLDDVLHRLEHGDGSVDLARFLVGSEGTLAVTAAATVRLVERPAAKALLVASFEGVPQACSHVKTLVDAGPAAVELMDAFIIDAAADQPVFAGDVARLPGLGGRRPGAVLLVEFHAGDRETARRDAVEAVARAGIDPDSTVVIDDPAAQARVWAIRTTGLGLISKPDGNRQPMPGLEDCGVPVDELATFQREFDALIRSHGWQGVFYAHASVGLLHVRPRIDLGSGGERDAFMRLREETLDLVLRHGGSISGEHGDGRVRGDLVARMYGPRIVEAFGEVKRLFDPRDLLNPGNKTADRHPLEDLRFDHEVAPDPVESSFFHWPEGGPLEAARACNGNGLCRRHEGGAMCPSYRAMLDERHSTRGRANALRLAIGGRLQDGDGPAIWDREDVGEVLSKCLSCKACRHECPSNVDLSKLKAEYTARSRNGRPASLRERALGRAGLHLRRAGRFRSLARAISAVPGVDRLLAGVLGLDPRRPLPRLAAHPAREAVATHARADAPVVAILEDCFTAELEPRVVEDASTILDAFGWRVARVRLATCCGRPQVSSGLLEEARALVESSAPALLRELDGLEATALVVLEPSCLSALREEWRELVTDVPESVTRRIASMASSLEVFLDGHWDGHPRRPEMRFPPGAVIHPHCHAKLDREATTRLMERLGIEDATVLDSGCCGLAGSFGYRRENAELSRAIFDQSLGATIEGGVEGPLVAAGTSCRHQCLDLGGATAVHPASVLAGALV